jgi:6-phosphogluconolactonase
VLVAMLAGGAWIGLAAQGGGAVQSVLLYIGTYTGAKSKGIYSSRLDLKSGTLSAPVLAAETANPSFIAIHPTRDFLYAVNEIGTFEGKPSGSVSAFTINRTAGTLTAINRQPSVGGGPAHLTVDHGGKNVLVANYGGGSVAVLPIGADGALKPATAFIQHKGSSVNADRQKEPHAHSVNVDSSDRIAYVADLGLDKVMIYRLDAATGALTTNDPPFAAAEPGAGPRHLSIHPQGGFAYVINELQNSVTVFARDSAHGGLTCAADDLDAARGSEGPPQLQHRGSTRAPVGKIPLRIEPRTRQHLRLHHRTEDGTFDVRRNSADAGLHAPRVRHRSFRRVPRRRQPAL